MKWAANKRLHFEIGLIKAIQSLNDARISDVIKALAGAGTIDATDASSATTDSPRPAAEPAPAEAAAASSKPSAEPVAKKTTPEATPEAKLELTPETKKPAKKKGLDALIEDAPEKSAEAPPTLNPETSSPEPQAEEKNEGTQSADDSFYQDPLIKDALKIFEGTLKN
jgi:DNA polymerase-3 subunit gamma/tau